MSVAPRCAPISYAKGFFAKHSVARLLVSLIACTCFISPQTSAASQLSWIYSATYHLEPPPGMVFPEAPGEASLEFHEQRSSTRQSLVKVRWVSSFGTVMERNVILFAGPQRLRKEQGYYNNGAFVRIAPPLPIIGRHTNMDQSIMIGSSHIQLRIRVSSGHSAGDHSRNIIPFHGSATYIGQCSSIRFQGFLRGDTVTSLYMMVYRRKHLAGVFSASLSSHTPVAPLPLGFMLHAARSATLSHPITCAK